MSGVNETSTRTFLESRSKQEEQDALNGQFSKYLTRPMATSIGTPKSYEIRFATSTINSANNENNWKPLHYAKTIEMRFMGYTIAAYSHCTRF